MVLTLFLMNDLLRFSIVLTNLLFSIFSIENLMVLNIGSYYKTLVLFFFKDFYLKYYGFDISAYEFDGLLTLSRVLPNIFFFKDFYWF